MNATAAHGSASSPHVGVRRSGGALSSVSDPHLKDVYAAWLKDLYEDNPAKIVKALKHKTSNSSANGGSGKPATEKKKKKKKKKKEEQLLHLLQATEASASKHISQRKESKLPPVQIPASRADVASAFEEAQQRRHYAVASEANCTNYEYRAPFQPGLAFFRLLVDAAVRDHPHNLKTSDSAANFEIPSFPVRIPPTLLRVANCNNDSQPSRLALLFTHEAKDDAIAGITTNGTTANNEDPTGTFSSISFVLFVQVFATERQYREQRKVLLRLFMTDQQQLCTSSDSVLAVSKHASDASCKSNATFLLKTCEDVEVAIDRLWNGTLAPDPLNQQGQQEDGGDDSFSHSCAVQKYVPFKGSTTSTSVSRKAWITRPVYRKKDRASWIWVLTDSANSHMTDSASHDSCQLVKCTAPQSWTSPRLIASSCSHFFENLLRVSITELDLDLIQDSDGKWWLLQVKAFQVRRRHHHRPSSAVANTVALDTETRVKSAPTRLEGCSSLTQLHKKWRCTGQYCNGNGETQNNQKSSMVCAAPSGYLTKKVLLSCEFYEKYRTQSDMSVTSGFANFSTALSFHLQHQVSKRERNQLYESQPLCSVCVTKYHFIREQWIDATSTTTTLSTTKTVRKKTQHGGLASPGINAPPRLLPSLQSTSTPALSGNSNDSILPTLSVMKSSNSAPVIQRTIFQQNTTVDHHKQLSVTPERPEYLSEMDKIEEMLCTAHDAKFASTQSSKTKQQPVANLPFVDVYEEDDEEANRFSRFLRKRSEADSVEEMWKSISLPKPISTSASVHSTTDGAHRRLQVQYNSYSLANELEKQQQANSDRIAPPASQILPVDRLEGHERREERANPSAAAAANATSSVHTIAISSCKQVFYDEAYRERVVSEAKDLLFHQHQSVRLVIVPNSIPEQAQPSGDKDSIETQQQQNHQDDDSDQELAEMALRTLFLDLSQSAATDRMAASLRKMPAIVRESSGCTTMLLTANN